MKVDEHLELLQKNHQDVILVNLHHNCVLNSPTFSIGLLYVATVLVRAGFKVRCLDMTEILDLDAASFRRLFVMSRPRLVGFTVISDNLFEVEACARLVKRLCPDTTVVAGGPLATAWGARLLKRRAFDVVVQGEGEFPMLRLAAWKVRGEGALEDIPGLVFCQEERVVATAPAQLIDDLDALPHPDRSLVPPSQYAWVVSARGCPYHCAFCFKAVHGSQYRPRSVADVVEEIIAVAEGAGGPVLIDLVDEFFVGDIRRVLEFCHRLEEYRREQGSSFAIIVQGRANVIARHPEILEPLKRAGVVSILIGIESGCPQILETCDKRLELDAIRGAVRNVAEVGGLALNGNFILGNPGESEETVAASLEFARELLALAPGVLDLRRVFLAPYPGTRIVEHPEEYDLQVSDPDFRTFVSMDEPATFTSHLSVERLRVLGRQFDRGLEQAMEALADRIPREMVVKAWEWSVDYALPMWWYRNVIARRPVIHGYLSALRLRRNVPLDGVPAEFEEAIRWYAQRVIEGMEYAEDGSTVILPPSLGGPPITEPEEFLIYRLCSGKLSIGRMLGEFRAATASKMSSRELYQAWFVPTFRKLEATFHVFFHP